MKQAYDNSEFGLLDRVCEAIREEPVPHHDLVPVRLNDTIQKRPASKAATRLMVCMAALVGFALLSVSSLTWFGTNSAFASMQTAIANTKSLRCKVLHYHDDNDPIVVSNVMVQGVGSKSDGPGGTEAIVNLRQRVALAIDHQAKTATKMPLYLEGNETSPADDFYSWLRSVPTRNIKSLGQAEWQGKTVDKYEINLDGIYVAYVDPTTKLPIRLEMDLPKALPGGKRYREVMTDFVFDAPVDESLFAINAPKDYKLIEQAESSTKPEEPGKLVVSPEKGIGNVPMGSSQEAIIASFGKPEEIKEFTPNPNAIPKQAQPDPNEKLDEKDKPKMLKTKRLSYFSKGFELTLLEDAGLTQIRCFGKKSMGFLAREFQGATENGLRLGASLEQVIKLLGKPQVRHKGRDEVLDYPSLGYQFVFEDSKIVSFQISKPLKSNVMVIDLGDGKMMKVLK